MSTRHESEPKLYYYTRTMCGICTHVTCAVFTGFITVLSKPGSSLFSWHPFLMSLAFSFFMTEAILLFNPHSSPVGKLKHKTKGRLHWILQCLCVFCAIVGLIAIAYNKNLNEKPHFTSWHGLIGLVTVIVVVLQSLGALSLLYPKLAKGWSLAKLKRYHATSGLLTYLLGSISLLLGLCTAWFSSNVSGYVWYLAALCPTLCALVIMSQVTNAYMAKKRQQY
ncbi:Cytochrome b561 domain-containing protein 2 [Triplophysa tibetana]|uniref:ascorbate ferrireductase (transmembrane) n=1 Tax=Triplophysa tibetana TaxID=1572043 RepID=A0A5A9NSP5_9TELE|nr:Cytochrome b561 domain-containing protein 2 [Triplophysa tibetana]